MSIKELDINDYYFHSIVHDGSMSFNVIRKIISDRAILSPKLQHSVVTNSCHKDNEICLSHITEDPNNSEYRSCLDIYVNRLMSFIIDKNFSKKNKVYKPELLPTSVIFEKKGTIDKYTNLYDEYRTIGRIPFKYIKGLCIPYKELINNPVKFLTFMDDFSQVAFYNGYFPQEYYDILYEEKNNEKSYIKRVDSMDNYIECLNEMIKKSNAQLPIYYYDDKKLVLK